MWLFPRNAVHHHEYGQKSVQAGSFCTGTVPNVRLSGLKPGYLDVVISVALGAVVMLMVAMVVNNIPATRKHPEFWLLNKLHESKKRAIS